MMLRYSIGGAEGLDYYDGYKYLSSFINDTIQRLGFGSGRIVSPET